MPPFFFLFFSLFSNKWKKLPNYPPPLKKTEKKQQQQTPVFSGQDQITRPFGFSSLICRPIMFILAITSSNQNWQPYYIFGVAQDPVLDPNSSPNEFQFTELTLLVPYQ